MKYFSVLFFTILNLCLPSAQAEVSQSQALSATLQNLKNEKLVMKVTDHGVLGDGETMNTNALQAMIDKVSAAGGGVLWFPKGKYVTGTIWLKSNLTLNFDEGAELLGSTDWADYPTEGLREAREGQRECLIYAEDAENVQLRGLGLIDGRGTAENFPKRRMDKNGKRIRGDRRPRLLRMESCKNVSFVGLTYTNTAFWGIHLIDCHDVRFSGVTVNFQDNQPNNDGIDLDGCENVLIENCNIKAGDDAICLKSSLNPCRNIVVRGCKVSSHTAALKFGTSSRGGFIDIDVSDCYFYDSPMGAIKLQSVDGGTLENVKISRITMENVGCPIFIRLGNRGRDYEMNKDGQGAVGVLRNVVISDIDAEVTLRNRGDEETGVKDIDLAWAGPIMITGIPGHYVEGIHLKNVTISFPGKGTKAHVKAEVPEDVAKYPEQFFFGVLPAWGAYVRHAKDICFENVRLDARSEDGRERVVLLDTEKFEELKN